MTPDDPLTTLTAFDIAFRNTILTAPADAKVREAIEYALNSGRALTVAKARPALDVATQVESLKPNLVIVTDPDTGTACGYVFPRWVTRQVREKKQIQASSFAEAVQALMNDAALRPSRTHLHKWLNLDRPV